MHGWRPEPEPPPGVPEHLVGKVHHVNAGGQTFIGIDPGHEDATCVTDLELLEYHLRDVNPENRRARFAADKLRRTTARDIEARLMLELQREY